MQGPGTRCEFTLQPQMPLCIGAWNAYLLPAQMALLGLPDCPPSPPHSCKPASSETPRRVACRSQELLINKPESRAAHITMVMCCDRPVLSGLS